MSGLRPIRSDRPPVTIWANGPDRGVRRGEDADLGEREARRRVEQREQAPRHAVVEVVDETGLGGGRKVAVAERSYARTPRARAAERAIEHPLLVLDVPARLAHEEDGRTEAENA